MIDLKLVFQSLKERCYGNQFWAKSGKLAHPTFIHHIGIPEWIGASERLCERLNDDDLCASGRNLVSFRPVMPEFMRLECVQQALTTLFLLLFARGQHC